jgi:ABC-type glycerol-3-phosphate transport system substrate-binding protein
MGDFLTSGLNAIPGRTSDQQAHEDVVGDPFVGPFVEALQTSRTEAILAGAQEVKTALHTQIEAAWFGEKTPEEALNDAAEEANRILGERG